MILTAHLIISIGTFWEKVGTTVGELNGGLVLQRARGIDAWQGLNSLRVNREHVACFVLEAVIRITLDRTEDNSLFLFFFHESRKFRIKILVTLLNYEFEKLNLLVVKTSCFER